MSRKIEERNYSIARSPHMTNAVGYGDPTAQEMDYP